MFSNKANLLLDLYRRHMQALHDGQRDERKRLFRLIEDFEWAYPDAKTELD